MAEFLKSDSDDSDLELLAQLSDWDADTDSETEDRQRASPKRIKRVNYMQSLDDAEFTFRFRLSKTAVNSLLEQLMPYVRVTSTRCHFQSEISLRVIFPYVKSSFSFTGIMVFHRSINCC